MLYAYYTLPAKPNSKIVIEVFMGSWQFSLVSTFLKKLYFSPRRLQLMLSSETDSVGGGFRCYGGQFVQV